MAAHGGTLELRSEPGQGTEVLMGFPAFQPPAAETPGAGESLAETMAPRRILLVDDDELIRAAIPAMLEALGHEVHTAAGGREALECLAGGLEVDLVILDMKMPDMDGAQTLPRLLALRPGQEVLLATGHSDQDPRALMAGRPNVTMIQKPFTLQEFRDRLRGREPIL
jgi:CheY-like chemotaxis protein